MKFDIETTLLTAATADGENLILKAIQTRDFLGFSNHPNIKKTGYSSEEIYSFISVLSSSELNKIIGLVDKYDAKPETSTLYMSLFCVIEDRLRNVGVTKKPGVSLIKTVTKQVLKNKPFSCLTYTDSLIDKVMGAIYG